MKIEIELNDIEIEYFKSHMIKRTIIFQTGIDVPQPIDVIMAKIFDSIIKLEK